MSIFTKLIVRPLIKREIKKMVKEELFGLRPTTWIGVLALVLVTFMGAFGKLPDWQDMFLTILSVMFGKTAVVEGLKNFRKDGGGDIAKRQ